MTSKGSAGSTKEEEEEDKKHTDNLEGSVRPSILIHLIRHAESQNNEVYRDARRIFKGGTPDFDLTGWEAYVDKHRSHDPGLSAPGKEQAEKLAEFLVSDLKRRSSTPVRIVTSPMRRTLETIRPTLEGLGLKEAGHWDPDSKENCGSPASVIVNAFFFESEGCHVKDEPRPGMNRQEIFDFLCPKAVESSDLRFEGFPSDPDAGWYEHGTGPETRYESEERAAKFYVWFCEYLDEMLAEAAHAADVFDAGVSGAPLQRRTVCFIGHGDFMALILKRVVAGFGYTHEQEGVTHRSAFVHFNTGVTDLEYFGSGRFLIMASNQTPHLPHSLLTGGGLKDGWSYLMPDDKFVLDGEVSVAFSDEVDWHVREQADALRNLYLNGRRNSSVKVKEEVQDGDASGSTSSAGGEVTLVVKRGLQVVGCASFHEETGLISDVVVRPSARGSQVGRSLVESAKVCAQKVGAQKVVAEPETEEAKEFFKKLGFEEVGETSAGATASRMEFVKLK